MMKRDLRGFIPTYNLINLMAKNRTDLRPVCNRFSTIIDEANDFFFAKCDHPSKWKTGEEAIKEFQPKFDELTKMYGETKLGGRFDKDIIEVLTKNIVENLNWFKKKTSLDELLRKKDSDKKATKGKK